MEPTKWLFLIRHGEVEQKYHRVFGGRIDMELSPAGHQQVAALANYVNRVRLEAIFCSPMKRVQQTMQPLLELTQLAPRPLEGLREVDFGSWTGYSWDQVQQQYNVSAFEWLDQLEAGAIEGAESVPGFRERVANSLNSVLASDHKFIAVVCHGGVIRMLLSLLLDIPFVKTSGFDIEYASLTRIKCRPGKTEMELMNFAPWRDLPGAA